MPGNWRSPAMSMPAMGWPSMLPGPLASKPLPCVAGSAPKKSASTGRCRSRVKGIGREPRPLDGLVAQTNRQRPQDAAGLRACDRGNIKIEQQLQRIEERRHQVEQGPEPDAPGNLIVLADRELAQPVEARSVACDQPAAAQEGTGDVAGLEVVRAGVPELGCRV